MTTPHQNCIFCKIVQKEIPAQIVYEDENFLALLDIRPISAGHCLVIPKQHYRWVWDVPNTAEYFTVTHTIALAQRKAFSTEAIHLKIVGEEVHHAHIWVYPAPDEVTADPKAFEENAEKLRQVLK